MRIMITGGAGFIKKSIRKYAKSLQVIRFLKSNVVIQSVKKLIYANLDAMHGRPQYLSINKEHSAKPSSPYGASKLIDKLTLQQYSLDHNPNNLKSIILRFFRRFINKNVRIRCLPPRKGDIEHSYANIKGSKKFLNWHPRSELKLRPSNMIRHIRDV